MNNEEQTTPKTNVSAGTNRSCDINGEDLDELLEDFVEASAAVVSALSDITDRVGGPFPLSVIMRRIADRAEKIRQNKRPGHSEDSE